MYVVELSFECFTDTTISAVDGAINGLMDAFRYNGQVIGREFPAIIDDAIFRVRAVCPEKESLHPQFHSPQVSALLDKLAAAGLLTPKIKILGRDLNSEAAAEDFQPSWQVLYTTYVHTCSPLRCGETLMPIPLYRLGKTLEGDHKTAVKWQTEWQACDEIQMAGSSQVEQAVVHEIRDIDSDLFQRGMMLRSQIETLSEVPTYYYQYQVGGESLEQEQQRLCPSCGGQWFVGEAIHGIFHFKCDQCRIVSNISWEFI